MNHLENGFMMLPMLLNLIFVILALIWSNLHQNLSTFDPIESRFQISIIFSYLGDQTM